MIWIFSKFRSEFYCQHGVGHSPVWSQNTIHGCCEDSCCSRDDFPGRLPVFGDIAICGRGSLGIVTQDSLSKELVIGRHLTSVIAKIGSIWHSRCWCILGNVRSDLHWFANGIEGWDDILGGYLTIPTLELAREFIRHESPK